MISSLFLLILFFWTNPYLILGVVFLSSLAGSLAWPAIRGAFVDYIVEAAKAEKEIEGLEDFFTNLGYILGPMLAGFLADLVGNGGAFSALGLMGVLVSLILIWVTPKKINVKV